MEVGHRDRNSQARERSMAVLTHMALTANRVSLSSRATFTWEHRGQVLEGVTEAQTQRPPDTTFPVSLKIPVFSRQSPHQGQP